MSQIEERIINNALWMGLILTLFFFLYITTSTLLFPYGLDYGEAPLIDQAKRLIAHEEIYKANLDEPPYVISNYPPLYISLISILGILTNLPLLQVGRAISLVSSLTSAFIIGKFASHLSKRRLSGMVAAALFLGHPFVTIWSPLARVDLLALGLSLTALWILYTRWDSWPWLAVAALCLLGAIYTRQTYALAAPVASAVWLWKNNRLRALIFITSLVGSCLALFMVLNTLTRGGFYINVITANVNPYRLERMLSMNGMFIQVWPFVIFTAPIQIIREVKRKDHYEREASRRSFILYGLLPYTCGALLSSFTVGKVGSNVNYFLELSSALAIWIGCSTAKPMSKVTIRKGQIILSLLILCQIIWSLTANWLISYRVITEKWSKLSEYEEVFQEVRQAASRGPILADDYLFMVILAGQRIYYQPFEYYQLYNAGIWAPTNLVAEIQDRKFSLVLLNKPGSHLYQERWPSSITQAIKDNYIEKKRWGELIAYEPKSSSLNTSPTISVP